MLADLHVLISTLFFYIDFFKFMYNHMSMVSKLADLFHAKPCFNTYESLTDTRCIIITNISIYCT